MAKVCLVIMDGASHDAVLSECGYLEAAVEAGHARRWKMRTCLPTISAAMYETIHTGLAPVDHGILGNDDLRPTRCANVFHTLKSAGKIGAAVAHSYYHTLYGGTPFDVFDHIEIDDASAPIPFARYYTMEGYGPINSCLPAEIDLCAQAWGLVVRNRPDYLLVHSCGPDTLGHTYTGDSPEYRKQIWRLDNALSRFIPRMTEAGYQVMVTADHGMNADGHHAGPTDVLRHVAFYHFGAGLQGVGDNLLDQRAIAPTILNILGVPIPDQMRAPPITAQS